MKEVKGGRWDISLSSNRRTSPVLFEEEAADADGAVEWFKTLRPLDRQRGLN